MAKCKQQDLNPQLSLPPAPPYAVPVDCNLQQQDRRPAAAALDRSWHKIHDKQQEQQLDQHHQQQQAQQQQQGQGSSLSGLHSSSEPQQQPQGQLISQQQLRQLLQQQLGYTLSVRPSNIEHQDAGGSPVHAELFLLCAVMARAVAPGFAYAIG